MKENMINYKGADSIVNNFKVTEFDLKNNPTDFIYKGGNIVPGLCCCESMDKEASVKITPLAAIRLEHPTLQYAAKLREKELLEDSKQYLELAKKYQHLNSDERYVLNEFCSDFIIPYDYYTYIWYFCNEDAYTKELKTILTQDEIRHINENFKRHHSYLNYREKEVDCCPLKPQVNCIFKPALIRWLIKNQANRQVLEATHLTDVECTCGKNLENKPLLRKILPTAQNEPNVICYTSCLRTLLAAAKRQLRFSIPGEHHILQDLNNYQEYFFNKYLREPIKTFKYSYYEWLNHLENKNKQDEILQAAEEYRLHGIPNNVEYGLFCKLEKQEEGGKNRAIAPVAAMIKFILGPVTWALESLFNQVFPGYCGNANFQDFEEFYNANWRDGFTTAIQGDGSAFDLCQSVEAKHIDRLIYKAVAPHVHHVRPDDFAKVACAYVKLMTARLRYKDGVSTQTKLLKANIVGTVFSGAPDTTLMNTTRMAIYNHYTLSKLGYTPFVDYRLKAKGDDFMFFLRDEIDPNSHYQKYWAAKSDLKDPTIRRGTGQVLKFLTVGFRDFTKLDFCSTAVLPKNDGTFKVMRRPERMLMFNPYSRNATKMSITELHAYMLQEAVASELCHGKLPFYSAYTEAYYAQAREIEKKLKDQSIYRGKDNSQRRYRAIAVKKKLQTVSKTTFPIPEDEIDAQRGRNNTEERLAFMFGKDFAHHVCSMISNTTISPEEVNEFLLSNYHITQVASEQLREVLSCRSNFNYAQACVDLDN